MRGNDVTDETDIEAQHGDEAGHGDQDARADEPRTRRDLRFPILIGAAAVVSIVLGLWIRGTGDDDAPDRTPDKERPAIRDTTKSLAIGEQLPIDPQYGPFLSLAAGSGWLQELNGTAEFTVFIPDADAFAAIAPERLAALNDDPTGAGRRFLEHRIVEGRLTFVELIAGGSRTIAAVDGSEIEVVVDGSTVRVDGAEVTKHDINAKNGVIHVTNSAVGGDDEVAPSTDAPEGGSDEAPTGPPETEGPAAEPTTEDAVPPAPEG